MSASKPGPTVVNLFPKNTPPASRRRLDGRCAHSDHLYCKRCRSSQAACLKLNTELRKDTTRRHEFAVCRTIGSISLAPGLQTLRRIGQDLEGYEAAPMDCLNCDLPC